MSLKSLGKKMAFMLQAAVLTLGVGSAAITGMALSSAPAYAAAAAPSCAAMATVADGAACSKGASQKANLFGNGGIFTVIANTLTFVIGAISVIYVMIGGLRYVTANGDSKSVTAAKDTIMYALIGVVVAVVSYAVVNFVITALNQAK